MTQLSNRSRSYDFVAAFWDDRYNFVTGTIKNVNVAAADAGDIYPGLPLNLNSTQWETLAAASVSGLDGFFADPGICEAIAAAATSVKTYKILTKGPAIINLDAIVADLDGAAFTLSTIITRIAALNPPIAYLREPTNTETQTT